MGFIIDDILLAPVNAVIWLGEKLKEAADAELYDQDKIKAELGTLQLQLEMGEISDSAYQKEEKILLERLNQSRAAKED